MSITHSVFLNGPQPGISKKVVTARLALLFKSPTSQIDKLLDSGLYKIKGGLDARTATEYKKAI
jgi:hypothetical protein